MMGMPSVVSVHGVHQRIDVPQVKPDAMIGTMRRSYNAAVPGTISRTRYSEVEAVTNMLRRSSSPQVKLATPSGI